MRFEAERGYFLRVGMFGSVRRRRIVGRIRCLDPYPRAHFCSALFARAMYGKGQTVSGDTRTRECWRFFMFSALAQISPGLPASERSCVWQLSAPTSFFILSQTDSRWKLVVKRPECYIKVTDLLLIRHSWTLSR